MRVLQYFIPITAALLIASPAAAQDSGYSGGLSYTAVKKQPAPEQSGGIQSLKISPDQEEPQKEPEETAADKVWKKYKDLAAGTYSEEKTKAEENTKASEKPEDDALPDPNAPVAAPPPPAPTGVTAILEAYQSSKEQRSRMHSIKVTTPPPQKKEAKDHPLDAYYYPKN